MGFSILHSFCIPHSALNSTTQQIVVSTCSVAGAVLVLGSEWRIHHPESVSYCCLPTALDAEDAKMTTSLSNSPQPTLHIDIQFTSSFPGTLQEILIFKLMHFRSYSLVRSLNFWEKILSPKSEEKEGIIKWFGTNYIHNLFIIEFGAYCCKTRM